MTLFIFAILTNSLYCLFINKATAFEYIVDDAPEHGVIESSKMLLWKIRFYSLRYFGKFYSKPICTCLTCMAGLHSLYIFWPLIIHLYGFHYHQILLYIVYIGVLGGTNYILSELLDLINSVKNYLDSH